MIKTNDSFTVRGTDIIFAPDSKTSFDYPVASVVEFDDFVVVLLDVPPDQSHNENVYGVSREGNVLWQVPPRKHVYANSPYTYAERKGDSVFLSNWDGLELTVDAATGVILSESYGK